MNTTIRQRKAASSWPCLVSPASVFLASSKARRGINIFRSLASRAQLASSILCLTFSSTGCSAKAPPPTTPNLGESSDTTRQAQASAEEAEAEAMAAIAAAEAGFDDEEDAMAAIAAAESEMDAEEKQRDVVYRISGERLFIEVDGASFTPTVTPIKIGKGWGLRFDVEATTEKELTLFAADAGPLAFAAWVITDGMREKYFDARVGGTEIPFLPGTHLSLSRTWPSKGLEPILPNRDVEIQVGLWGIGSEHDTRRPLPKFCTIRMKVRAEGVSAEVLPPQ